MNNTDQSDLGPGELRDTGLLLHVTGCYRLLQAGTTCYRLSPGCYQPVTICYCSLQRCEDSLSVCLSVSVQEEDERKRSIHRKRERRSSIQRQRKRRSSVTECCRPLTLSCSPSSSISGAASLAAVFVIIYRERTLWILKEDRKSIGRVVWRAQGRRSDAGPPLSRLSPFTADLSLQIELDQMSLEET